MSTPAIRKFASTSSMQKDGVFQLDAVEKELVHESFTVDTRDHEDHTFCGIMFKVECETDLPCRYLEIQSVHVRGDLGPMTVWVTPDTWEHKQEEESECGRRSTRFQIRTAEETKKIAYELFLIWNQCRVKSLP